MFGMFLLNLLVGTLPHFNSHSFIHNLFVALLRCWYCLRPKSLMSNVANSLYLFNLRMYAHVYMHQKMLFTVIHLTFSLYFGANVSQKIFLVYDC